MRKEEQFWSDGDSWNCAWTWTLAVLLLIFIWRLLAYTLAFRFNFGGGGSRKPEINHRSVRDTLQPLRSTGIVSDLDLENLIENLDESSPANADVVWENVVEKTSNSLAYKAKCCKPKDSGPLKYLSVTTFEDCSIEVLLNFYMDNAYRTQWDKTVVQHEQLHLDQGSGTEIGRTIKKFPFLTPREYVLAWRVWQGKDGSYYCFSKECEHPSVPNIQKRYIRVAVFRSGWRIRKGSDVFEDRIQPLISVFPLYFCFAVPGRNACEIKMVHQEDAGLNVEMGKLAFAKGIWSYVCKMNDALRKYSAEKQRQLNSTASAAMFIQKVPPEFEVTNDTVHQENSMASVVHQVGTSKSRMRKLTRRPSNKLIANGLIFLGGVVCLSRGHSSLGAKVAMAYMLGKLTKRNALSKQTG
ncbi:hypothetical protein ACJIZ3_010075 [Penstemon smallii]|uniref:START domain-containing protein n=1 Tax=Penstemon smallii TaxID=265156 RepID=A0ABD3TEC5_9LAMI